MLKVEGNINLVSFTINKFFPIKYDYEDKFQIGCIGLIKAAKNFDETLGVKFSTYAVSKIRGEISRKIRDDKWRLGSRQQRIDGEAKIPISLDAPINFEGQKEKSKIETITYINDYITEIEAFELKHIIETILSRLEREVLILNVCSGYSQKQIAEKFKISQCQVSRLKRRALKKLREVYKEK